MSVTIHIKHRLLSYLNFDIITDINPIRGFACVVMVKVKVKIKVKFTLKQATKVQRGSRGLVYTFFNLGAKWGEWSTPRPGRFTP